MKNQTNVILAILIFICIVCDLCNCISYENMATKRESGMSSNAVEYHISSEEIGPQGSWLQKKGELKFYTWADMFATPYNKKKSKYGSRSYVPSYEDSIYLSHYRKPLLASAKK